MTLALLEARPPRGRGARGQPVDPSVYRCGSHAQRRDPRFLTWQEADDLRSWMPEYIGRIVPIAILTMLRRGEILGLRDLDVDFEARAVSAFTQHQDGERVATKTRAGRRTVDVGPATLGFCASNSWRGLPMPRGSYSRPSGQAWDAHNFMSRVFKPAAAADGNPRAHVSRPAPHRRVAHDRSRLPRQGDRRADGPLRRRRPDPDAVWTPLQGRSPAGRNRPRVSHVFDAPTDPRVGQTLDGAQLSWDV